MYNTRYVEVIGIVSDKEVGIAVHEAWYYFNIFNFKYMLMPMEWN